jgi:peptidoglycan/LPS O-acetylase OafA/YrhL
MFWLWLGLKAMALAIIIGVSVYKILEQPANEKEKLLKAVASLDAVRRKGKTKKFT